MCEMSEPFPLLSLVYRLESLVVVSQIFIPYRLGIMKQPVTILKKIADMLYN